MDLSSDAELLAIFREELTSRAEHLVEGAQSLSAGGIDPKRASDLHRDAHTVKGSSRMMGFVALGDAGEVLEFAWRSIADGTHNGAVGDLAACLEKAASLLISTMDADPVKGTPQLQAAIAAVKKPVPVPEPRPES